MHYPIAIVGIAFRFPGDLGDEHTFWEALTRKRDLIGQIPPDRWATNELQHNNRLEPGRSITFSAGTLSRIDEFDAAFFGISPREALSLDPQQRLLLELSWEAMENAGISPSSLAGSDCAVYVGISSTDYGTSRLDDLAAMNAYSITGSTTSIAANRLSYVFDLHGPSLAVDTACSSSLVALHHACACLHTGEASAALVGGVSLLLHPASFIGFTKASMLSADGSCKPFDATSKGYVRAEGGAVLLLKPFAQALADGDAIQAVILASGVNTDGARKTGITMPSSEAQAELLQRVLAKSGLSGNDIDFIEAHGTGTIVGDPLEALAIGMVYGKGRKKPLPISSVKANLGHLEPASGMAGLVKTVLALQHRALPPTLHFSTPNPQIDFAGLNLEVVSEYQTLEKNEECPLNAGLNSFGFGGSNAHVILQEYCPPVIENTKNSVVQPPLFLSAHSDAALNALAKRYAELLRHVSAKDFYDIAYTAAHGRQRLEKRLGLIADSPETAAAILADFVRGNTSNSIVVENALPQNGGVAFVYSGNGTHWIGMGRGLLADSPRFNEILTWLDALISPQAGFSIRAELLAEKDATRFDNPVVVQPLLFVMQVAITILLRERGVLPVAVTGHSVGEVAAAWAAGALEIEEAIRVIVARSGARGGTLGKGGMAAVALSEEEARVLLKEQGKGLDVTIAAINSPNMMTLSGRREDLECLRLHLEAKGTFFRFLDLDYAFHSRHMDGLKKVLVEELKDMRPAPEYTATFVSTVYPDDTSQRILDAAYWGSNVREPVLFSAAINKLAELGCRVFVEIGPDAVMQRYIRTCLSKIDVKARVLPTLRKKNDRLARLDDVALRAHLLADTMDSRVFFPHRGKRVRLPNYPWQRERYWLPSTTENLHLLNRRRVHPLLGWPLPETEATWENILDPIILPWLADHIIGGAMVFPGAAYAEIALAAANQWLKGKQAAIEELDIISPILFDGEHARVLHFILNPRDNSFQIKGRQRLSADPWILHASGRIVETFQHPGSPLIEEVAESERTRTVDKETHYRLAASLGLDYGPAFQGLVSSRISENRLAGEVREEENFTPEASYVIHPGQMDLCFQSLIGFFQTAIESGAGQAFLPVKIGRLVVYQKNRISAFRTRLHQWSSRSALADFEILGPDKNIIALMTGCRFRAVTLHQTDNAKPGRWHIIPSLTPHPAEHLKSNLPTSEALARLCHASLAGFEAQRRDWFQGTLPLMEALVLIFAHTAFRKTAAKGPDVLFQLMSSRSEHTRWLTRLLQQEGLLLQHESTWQVADDGDLLLPDALWRNILNDSPTNCGQLTVLGSVGLHLPELLTERMDGASFLREIAHSPLMETLVNDPVYWGTRQAITAVFHHLAKDMPKNRRLRILEISAHPSEHPRELQKILSEDRLDYVFAAVNEETERRMQAEYRNNPNLTFARVNQANWQLSAEKSLPAYFDVVLLDHTLHRAFDPLAALTQSRQWLVSGGLLLIAERHPDWSADFLQGLDPNWWREDLSLADTGSPRRSSFCSPEAWRQVLRTSDFVDIASFIEPEAKDLAEGAYLLLAKRPSNEAIVLAAPEPSSWLLLTDEGCAAAMVEQVRERLTAREQTVLVADRLSNQDLMGRNHVVRFFSRDHAVEDAPKVLGQMLVEVQQLSHCTPKPPRLWLITEGGALASTPPSSWTTSPVQTAIWGFGRVVMNEYPELDCTLIDIAHNADMQGIAARLEWELLWPDGADEIVLADGERHTLLLTEEKAADLSPDQDVARFRLDFRVPGQLRNLLWLPEEEKPLEPGMVEVQTKATGLNFRDVMFLMGLLPEEVVENGFAGATLGLEFSGVVTRIGAGVDRVCPGDTVMGFGPSCFASHVITQAGAVIPMPKGWSFESAATVPTVFFTAYYALKHLADLQPGESVLIHGAAGGVGMAAIQLARHIGATVFATAGNDIKRDFVCLLGADYVLDSRSLAFEEEILTLTDGKGVDVVLNSLAGEAVRRNLHLLKPFGRFLELGKRDFVENTPVGLRPFKNNISYFGIDVDQLLNHRPKLAARMLDKVMELFREDILSPLPWQSFTADQVESAFRCMQQAHHIGKVVVSMADARPQIHYSAPVPKTMRFEKASSWLVSGGLSGFGLATARWLAEHGAGHIILLGRRGLQAEEAVRLGEELYEHGVNIHILACDVTDKEALAKVIEDLRNSSTLPPLKGIVHAAMVMDDRLIANMDEQSMKTVLAPKLLGAWHLHQLTLDLDLDHFVLFSSIATAIGNPGQANYTAANAGLEGLAALRRHMGLPASCISWGPLGDVGYLTQNTAVRDSLGQRLGAAPLTAMEALDQLDAILAQGGDQCVVARFDWNPLARFLPSADSRRFALLNHKRSQAPAADAMIDFRELIDGKTKDEVAEIVRSMIVDEVAQILCLNTERIDPNRSLHDLGMDSLMAVELSQVMEKRFAIQFPVMMLNEAPSIHKISLRIVDTLMGNGNGEDTGDDALAAMVDDLAKQHGEDLSPEEMDRILRGSSGISA